jgi:hypothetical protein
MPIGDWIDIALLRRLCHHSSGCIFAMAAAAVVGYTTNFFGLDADTVGTIHRIEDYVVIGLFLWLALNLGANLWRSRSGDLHGVLFA